MITRFFIAFFSIVHLNTKIVLISFFSKNQFVRIVYFDFKKNKLLTYIQYLKSYGHIVVLVEGE